MEKKTVVAGVLQDIHHVGILIVKAALERSGFQVVDIGSRAAQEDFVRAAVENNASAILVSTSTGQAELECEGMREKCHEAGLDNIVLYLGGNLVIDPRQERKWEDIEKPFKQMGYNRVYSTTASIEAIVNDLKADLGIQ